MKSLAIAVVPTFLFACVMALTGCSSSPKVQAQKPQYCYTSQTIVAQNGERVESKTVVECTDDQFKRLTAVRMGMANHCGIANRTVQSGDKLVNVQIKSCQILDHNGNVVGYEYVN
jgi:ABC-type sulfate transport system substrate-binding protein